MPALLVFLLRKPKAFYRLRLLRKRSKNALLR
jgi:hypothetical protein